MSAKERITLVIEQRSKHLPYPPDKRADGENIGFQILKGASAEEIGKIPEVQNCATLRDALIAINAPRTRFFTVGCEKSLNRVRGTFSKKGYLEFSYNHTDGLKDASGYFLLFFSLPPSDRGVRSSKPRPICLGPPARALQSD